MHDNIPPEGLYSSWVWTLHSVRCYITVLDGMNTLIPMQPQYIRDTLKWHASAHKLHEWDDVTVGLTV